jgi:hypothetical protein
MVKQMDENLERLQNEEAANREFYSAIVICDNCKLSADILIPKGEMISTAKCPHCECKTLRVSNV